MSHCAVILVLALSVIIGDGDPQPVPVTVRIEVCAEVQEAPTLRPVEAAGGRGSVMDEGREIDVMEQVY